MKLCELTKLIEDDNYSLRMNELPDMYNLLQKLGVNLPNQYSYDVVEKEIENISELELCAGVLHISRSLDNNLLYNLKVLKISNKSELEIYIGYEKFHN